MQVDPFLWRIYWTNSPPAASAANIQGTCSIIIKRRLASDCITRALLPRSHHEHTITNLYLFHRFSMPKIIVVYHTKNPTLFLVFSCFQIEGNQVLVNKIFLKKKLLC